jgi:hypothetical protein
MILPGLGLKYFAHLPGNFAQCPEILNANMVVGKSSKDLLRK